MHGFAAGPHNDEPEIGDEYAGYEETYVDDLSGRGNKRNLFV